MKRNTKSPVGKMESENAGKGESGRSIFKETNSHAHSQRKDVLEGK